MGHAMDVPKRKSCRIMPSYCYIVHKRDLPSISTRPLASQAEKEEGSPSTVLL
jgi:hypothetical protein